MRPLASTWRENSELASARTAWLMLQAMLHPGRRCPPMPGDPQPERWPSRAKKKRVALFDSGERTSETVIERLKRTYRVEEIASHLTDLAGNGDVLTGKCPFHNERKGRAFAVWTNSQRWRCFGRCATGGDVIDLVRECRERGIEWR